VKILILGGHGFVGKNVVEILKDSEYELFSLSRRDGLDLTDYEVTKRYFSEIKPEVIINCAALVGSLNYVTQQAAEIVDINMRIILNIFKAAQNATPDAVLINPVANCAFPGELETYTEDSLWTGKIHQSVLSYGSTRRMMTVISECYKMQHGFRSMNFLVPNMYGPHDSTDPNKAHALNALISKMVKAKRENKKEIEVWGSGIAIREWLYAKDCAAIFLDAVEKIEAVGFDEPVNIGQNFGLSIRELVRIIKNETGFKGDIVWNRSMPDGAPRKVMDDTRFRKIFPEFHFTDFSAGIRETIKYYEFIYPY
jgi:GDP-L-fucose synthase